MRGDIIPIQNIYYEIHDNLIGCQVQASIYTNSLHNTKMARQEEPSSVCCSCDSSFAIQLCLFTLAIEMYSFCLRICCR